MFSMTSCALLVPSFHVGSGCQTPQAYQSALELSAQLFSHAPSAGHHFTLLDIGGGFPGDRGSDALFEEVTNSIKEGVATHFGRDKFPELKIIAEPGQCGFFFFCIIQTLYLKEGSGICIP